MGLMPFKRAGPTARQGTQANAFRAGSGGPGRDARSDRRSRWHYRYLVLLGMLFTLFMLASGCS